MSRPGTEEVHVIVWTIEINISTSQFLFSCLIHFAPRFYASRSDLEPVPDAGYTFSPTRRKPLDPGWTMQLSDRSQRREGRDRPVGASRARDGAKSVDEESAPGSVHGLNLHHTRTETLISSHRGTAPCINCARIRCNYQQPRTSAMVTCTLATWSWICFRETRSQVRC
jgi:hypothetical protein